MYSDGVWYFQYLANRPKVLGKWGIIPISLAHTIHIKILIEEANWLALSSFW